MTTAARVDGKLVLRDEDDVVSALPTVRKFLRQRIAEIGGNISGFDLKYTNKIKNGRSIKLTTAGTAGTEFPLTIELSAADYAKWAVAAKQWDCDLNDMFNVPEDERNPYHGFYTYVSGISETHGPNFVITINPCFSHSELLERDERVQRMVNRIKKSEEASKRYWSRGYR